jgi:two-component system nitrogen regulation sensor histidine kinase NtrY
LPDFPGTLNDTTAIIKEELQRLTTLLDQFVAFAQMKPPEPVLTPPEALLEPVKALFKKEIDSQRLIMRNVSRERQVPADRDAIRQVLINLIKNSFEAAAESHVTVTAANSEDGLEITVEDNGPGFSTERLQRKFQPEISGKKGGSGLGLIICRRIALDHGGDIDLYNCEKGGAGVRIVLPDKDGQNPDS